MSSSVENRHQPEVNRRTVNVLLGLLGLSGLAYGINRAIKKGFGIDINFSKNHPDGDDPESFDEQLESALAQQEDQASPEHEALSEVSPEIQEALEIITLQKTQLARSLAEVSKIHQAAVQAKSPDELAEYQFQINQEAVRFELACQTIIEKARFILDQVGRNPRRAAEFKAKDDANMSLRYVENAQSKMEEAISAFQELLATQEMVSDEDLIEEWKENGYVDLEVDLDEAMRRLKLLQEGIEIDGIKESLLPDSYRVLLMGLDLAEVYEIRTRQGANVVGFNLKTFELEIFEGENYVPFIPGNGEDIEKGDGTIVHRSELVDEETGTILALLSEKAIYFNFKKVSDKGETIVERRRVVVNWGTIPLLNKNLFFSTLFEIFPNLKGKHVKLVVQNEVFNPNMPQPAGFKEGIDFNLAVNFIDPVDGVNGDTVYLGRTRTIDRLTQGQDVGSDEGEAVLFPLYQLLRAVDRQKPDITIDNGRTDLTNQTDLMVEAGSVVPDGPATMIDFTPIER